MSRSVKEDRLFSQIVIGGFVIICLVIGGGWAFASQFFMNH